MWRAPSGADLAPTTFAGTQRAGRTHGGAADRAGPKAGRCDHQSRRDYRGGAADVAVRCGTDNSSSRAGEHQQERAEHFAEQSAPFEAEVGEVPSSHWLPFQEGGGRRPVPAGHNRRYAFALNLRGVCFACGHTADWGHVPVPRLSADFHPE